MTSLVDEFLNDLGADEDTPTTTATTETQEESSESSNINGDDKNKQQSSSTDASVIEGNIDFADVEWESVARLVRSDELAKHVERVEKLMEDDKDSKGVMGGAALVDDPEYEVLVESNRLVTEIDDEIALMHRYLVDIYKHKFPDLESSVQNALDYARVVKRIGNETDLTNVEMGDILPQSVVMVIKITSATDIGRKLTDAELQRAMRACDDMLRLNEIKGKILRYVSSRMNVVAPNLSAIVGPTVAAQLIGAAGGPTALSKIPASNIQALGKSSANFLGFSAKGLTASSSGTASATVRRVGFIARSDLINLAPPELKPKAGALIATKSALAARVDSFHSSPDGSFGRKLRNDIEETIKRWQEPPPPKLEKPLPAPDAKKRRNRGGRNARRIKAKYKMTEVRRKYNRIAFGTEGQIEDETTGEGFGMLGVEGSGQLRVRAETRIKPRQRPDQPGGKSTTPFYGGNQTISGLASTLSFTPMQGIHLENPLNALRRLRQTGGEISSTVSGTATALAGIGSTIPGSSSTVGGLGGAAQPAGQKRSYFSNTTYAAAQKKQKKDTEK